MKFLLLFLCIGCMPAFFAQDIDLQKAYDFINSVVTTEKSFNLSESMKMGLSFEPDSTLLESDSLFTEQDILFFSKQMEYAETHSWESGKINNSKLIPQGKLKRIFRDKKGWKRFRRKIGGCMNYLGLPIFTTDYHYCIFFQWVQCDGLMGKGNVSLYKFEDGKWTFVDTYAMGVS